MLKILVEVRLLKRKGKVKTLGLGKLDGVSSSATAFCPCRPCSNPGTDLGFFSLELLTIYSHLVLGFF